MKQFFAESFVFVFGEIYHCNMHDLEQLSSGDFEDYNRFREESRAIMDERKSSDINYKALHPGKELLRIRRGEKNPTSCSSTGDWRPTYIRRRESEESSFGLQGYLHH